MILIYCIDAVFNKNVTVFLLFNIYLIFVLVQKIKKTACLWRFQVSLLNFMSLKIPIHFFQFVGQFQKYQLLQKFPQGFFHTIQYSALKQFQYIPLSF